MEEDLMKGYEIVGIGIINEKGEVGLIGGIN